MRFLTDVHSFWFWPIWALFLIWQNYAFTYVSRARNSGSLGRHAIAALQSNGVWFLQFLFAVTAFNRIISGEYGWRWTLFAVLYYTAFTMAGSMYAHFRALRTEKGSAAVGANKRYAQVPTDEWTKIKRIVLNVPQEKWDAVFGKG